MDFALSEEQEMLKVTARNFLDKECPKKLVREMEEDDRGYPPELWKKMAGLGWQGICFPEKNEGNGGNFLDLATLLMEMGRACLPSPFFSTVVLGGLTVLDVGSEAQKKEFLPPIARGELIMALALIEPSGKYDASGITTKANKVNEGYVLDGIKLFVSDAHVSDWMIVVARTKETPKQGISLFMVNSETPGISITQLKTIAGDKQCEVVLNKVKVPKKGLIGNLNGGWTEVERVIDRAAVAKCCEMVGGAEQVFEMTLNYAKERVQFDRPIGSFQAIQHHCSNMAIDLVSCKLLTYQAAWMLSQDLPCRTEVAMAKAWTNEAYRRITALGHQIHGAVGFTMDHDVQLYYRRAKAAELAFGDSDFYRELVALNLEEDPAKDGYLNF